MVHDRTYPFPGLPIACPLDHFKPCWEDGEWVAGENITDNDFYFVEEASGALMDTHDCRMMALPYHLEHRIYCLDAVIYMLQMEIITQEDLKWYFRASRHIEPQRLRTCFVEMDNINDELGMPDREDFKKRMKLATIGMWNVEL